MAREKAKEKERIPLGRETKATESLKVLQKQVTRTKVMTGIKTITKAIVTQPLAGDAPAGKGVCIFWPKGLCRRGDECPYRHEGPEPRLRQKQQRL